MKETLAAEMGIRQLHARCVDAVWRKDGEAFAQCYSEDGIWKIAGLKFIGREKIAEGFVRLISVNERVLMEFGAPILQERGGVFQGRTYTKENVKRLDGTGLRTIGVYFEDFVEVNHYWLFKWRHFDMYYFGPPDLSEPMNVFTDYGPPPGRPEISALTAGLTVGR